MMPRIKCDEREKKEMHEVVIELRLNEKHRVYGPMAYCQEILEMYKKRLNYRSHLWLE